ncbi:MAG: glycerol-3-phosphate acyltransferase PlsX [Granulosicoccus sp.]|jgi:glycerol-3-phosphate acyltransferase PlsX
MCDAKLSLALKITVFSLLLLVKACLMNKLRIAIDVMGGDMGSQSILPAVVMAATSYPHIQFQLYGELIAQSAFDSLQVSAHLSNVAFTLAGKSVEMDDLPPSALRHKRDSSMALAIQSVATKQTAGCISAGNTGALVAMGMHFLRCYKGLARPALCKAIPVVDDNQLTKKSGHLHVNHHSYLLDLGANVNCSAEQLAQFACLGSMLCSSVDKQSAPTVRLLNIGHEAIKGSVVVQEAAELLQKNKSLNYQGFIEANEIFQGVANVIVCDGFSGNIALKASEGMARLVTRHLRHAFTQNLKSRLLAWMSSSILKRWQQSMSPDRYNGAYLLGLKGTVIKSHGNANQQQFFYALVILIEQVTQQSQQKIDMEALFSENLNQ